MFKIRSGPRDISPIIDTFGIIRGSEIIFLSATAIVTIVFGAFGIYIGESPTLTSIHTLYDAFWWAIGTITTVAYGEYYPITFTGRIIAGA